jgi:hypothetical protein
VANGASQDGGTEREFGWTFYNPIDMGDSGGGKLTTTKGRVEEVALEVALGRCTVGKGVMALRVYGVQLTTSQLLANFRAGPNASSNTSQTRLDTP